MSHTPTPYTLDGRELLVRGSQGQHAVVAKVMPTWGGTDEYETAAYIVQACNAHDALVAALTDLLHATEDNRTLNHFSALHPHALERARAALALAKMEAP